MLPNDVSTRTRLTREIELAIPVVSAAMDTVTEARLAIALARDGGIGVVHRNLSIEDQVAEVDKVKRSEAGMIVEPVTLPPDAPVADALALMARYRISGVPITDADGHPRRDPDEPRPALRERHEPAGQRADDRDRTSSPRRSGRRSTEAERILHRNKVEKLPVVDADGRAQGPDHRQGHLEADRVPERDEGRARAACAWRAAVGVGPDALERAEALVAAGADVLVLDTAHGHSTGVLEMARRLSARSTSSSSPATSRPPRAPRRWSPPASTASRSARGPGATCTTRVVAGVGVPQVTAIYDCARACAAEGVPLIADGGIRNSGDVAKAIAAGADTVMLGSVLAGTDEAPGDVILVQGERYKEYRGMGSLGAMKARSFSKDRYFQGDVEDVDKLVPEGIEGRVPYKGPVEAVLHQLVGGLRQSMGYCGAATIEEMKERTRFVRITAAGLRESHPHDMTITKEAPNYRR